MPLFCLKQIREDLILVIWKITENEEKLKRGVEIHPSDEKKVGKISHPDKRNEFFALRQCLKAALGENPEVFYKVSGKPYFKNGPYISFTHTEGFAGVVISKIWEVGIDLEIIKPQIARIAPKFIGEKEWNFVDKENLNLQTAIWGAKEVIIKIEGNRKLNFRKQLEISPFKLSTKASTLAFCHFNKYKKQYRINIEKMENLMLCYGWHENLKVW